MSQKMIVVLGATGNQGGSVIDTFLGENPTWQVRGITRDKSSTKAQTLARRNVQVVEADMARPLTLRTAFDGASVIFAVSDFMGIYANAPDRATIGQSPNAWAAGQEMQHLKNVIDEAAKVRSLERLVFSSLSNATKWSHGKFTHVFHFDGKANAEDYGRRKHPELWSKTSVLQACMFLEVLQDARCRPRRAQNGKIIFPCPWNPTMRIRWISAQEDSGPLVRALVLDEPGKNLLGYRDFATLPEVVAAFIRVTGLEAEVEVMSVKDWMDASSPDLVLEFEEFFKYWDEFGFEAQEDPRIVHPSQLDTTVQLRSIEDWLARQDWSAIIDGMKGSKAPPARLPIRKT